MARGKFEAYLFTVDGFTVGSIVLNADVVERFGITGLTTLEEASASGETKRVEPYSRRVFASRNNETTTKQTTVRAFTRAKTHRKNRINSGKKIKVSLGYALSSVTAGKKPTERYTTINFPLKASNYQIARWINTNFTSHKPSSFITPAGARFPVNIPQILAQTAGETEVEPAAAGTP